MDEELLFEVEAVKSLPITSTSVTHKEDNITDLTVDESEQAQMPVTNIEDEVRDAG